MSTKTVTKEVKQVDCMAFTGETEEGEIVFMLRFSGFTSLLEADEFMAAIEDVLNKNIFMVKKDERVRPN